MGKNVKAKAGKTFDECGQEEREMLICGAARYLEEHEYGCFAGRFDASMPEVRAIIERFLIASNVRLHIDTAERP